MGCDGFPAVATYSDALFLYPHDSQ